MNRKYLILWILILAALLRLYGFSRGDTVSDEVFYAFRAIGMLDFDEAELQTTPLEWFDPAIPWWTKFSFHDHPPLVFLVQHFFIKTFGENNFAFRFPSALLGLASIYLLYRIGRELYSKNAGLLAALLMAITVNHVFISRTGLQESYVIFFILLASYFFIKSLRQENYLIWTGLALGLAFLTKYTAFILAPIFLVYLLFFRRDYLRNKKLWLGALLALLIFSPVIIYNFGLYRATGHLDFQLSAVFGQKPEVWQVQPGKEIGTVSRRFNNFLPHLASSNSWLFLAAFALTILCFAYEFWKSPKETLLKHAFLITSLAFLLVLLVLIGPSFRFLSMLTPFLALGAAWFLNHGYKNIFKERKSLLIILAALIAFEAAYSINSQILYYPKGPKIWAWSEVRLDNYNWGYNELSKFIENELKGKVPAVAFEMKYEFLSDIHEKALKKALAQNPEDYPALIIYDGNIQSAAQLWVLDRLHIYHAWPIIKTEQFSDFLQKEGGDYFERAGFKYYYFIIPSGPVPLKAPPKLTNLGALFEKGLITNGKIPVSIKNPRGEEAFRVYKF